MSTNSPKYRNYFITANQGAECYADLLERAKEENTTLYALIVHDKDVKIAEDGTAKPKETHKHLALELKNPVSFNAIQKRFEGAHIEVMKYKKSTYQYLLHNSPKSGDKYQYAFEEIMSSNPDEVKRIIESEEIEVFQENLFLRYIVQGTRTHYQFVKRFGLTAAKQYWKEYERLLHDMYEDTEMQEDMEAMKAALENDLDERFPM